MTMHNHIERRAYPKGHCESCDVVWNILALVPIQVFDLEAAFREADNLLKDYGLNESLSYLTEKQLLGQDIKLTLEIALLKEM